MSISRSIFGQESGPLRSEASVVCRVASSDIHLFQNVNRHGWHSSCGNAPASSRHMSSSSGLGERPRPPLTVHEPLYRNKGTVVDCLRDDEMYQGSAEAAWYECAHIAEETVAVAALCASCIEALTSDCSSGSVRCDRCALQPSADAARCAV